MGARELVILLLGLAIVAVVLRGLFVALRGRRGQIRMAIDKNIPQNIDLDSLELAELPGGGARTIDRSLNQVNLQNSALDLAQARAAILDLGEVSDNDSHIPVLMDAVELGEIRPESHAEAESGEPDAQYDDLAPAQSEEYPDEEEDFESSLDAVPTITESLLEDEFQQEEAAEDPDSVLFDYDENDDEQIVENNYSNSSQADASQEIDPLQSVAPDYDPEPETNDGQYLDPQEEDDLPTEEEQYESAEAILNEERHDEYAENETADEIEVEEAETPVFDPVDSLDDFSMTAGDRIGFNGQTLEQTSLFDEPPEEEVKPKRKSLFSFFQRKPKSVQTEEPATLQSAPVADVESEPEPVPEPEIAQSLSTSKPIPFLEQEIDEPVDELEQVRATPAPERVQASPEISEVIVINVMAKKGRVFAGDDLLHLLITAGLKFGDMNIFHKRLSNDSQGAIVFSVANILNPGTFDLNNMEEFTTLGISLFLALPSPINNLDAFEQMLDVAQHIRGTLDGELKDDHRNGMTAQTIEHYRQRIQDFELQRLRATAGARA